MGKAILNCPAVARRKFLRQVLRRLLKYSYIANRLFEKGSDSTNNFNRFSLVNRFSEVPMMGCEPRQFAPHVSRNKKRAVEFPCSHRLVAGQTNPSKILRDGAQRRGYSARPNGIS